MSSNDPTTRPDNSTTSTGNRRRTTTRSSALMKAASGTGVSDVGRSIVERGGAQRHRDVGVTGRRDRRGELLQPLGPRDRAHLDPQLLRKGRLAEQLGESFCCA